MEAPLNDAQIPSEDDFAGPNLTAAASMIRDYGERNSLTPRQLLDTFNAGIAAAKLNMVPPRDHLGIDTVADEQRRTVVHGEVRDVGA
jgi:hypothetical protein